MKIKRSARMTSDISMSSMSDIAFLLIIFFMVATAFIFKDGLHLILPDKSRKPVVMKEKEIVTLEVKNTSLLLNSKKVEIAEIDSGLKKLFEENNQFIVLLKIDRKTKYNVVIDLIDSVKVAGFTKLSLRMTGK